MKDKMFKLIKDWKHGADIGNVYIIVNINCEPVEGDNVLDIPRYGMVEAAEKAKELNGYVYHWIEAVKAAMEKL